MDYMPNGWLTRIKSERPIEICLPFSGISMRMEGVETSRTSVRKPLDLLVQGRMRSRSVYVEVVDVSEGGCKIKGRHGFAEADETVILKIDGVRTPLGKIVWVDGEYAGLKFEGKMHPAIVDFLYNERMKNKESKKAGRAA